jgi:hypothetical protein
VIQIGDWVRVYGQILDPGVHPDEYLVEFFSHNEQWSGLVLRSRCEAVDPPPGIAGRCTHLWVTEMEATEVFLRCTRHLQHGAQHAAAGVTWEDYASHGYLEEK